MASGSRTRNRLSRAQQAGATRGRILEAASRLFLRDGFTTTTMAAIAGEAEVAVQTLYLSFGSKTAILQAAFDIALKGNDDPDGILETEWFQRASSVADGVAALRLFCAEAGRVIGRAAPIYDVIRAAAADPEVAAMLAHNKQLRADGFRMVTDALATREGFAAGLTASDAHVIVYTVVSEDSFLLMVGERGWTPDRWLAWTTATCVQQLFPSDAAG